MYAYLGTIYVYTPKAQLDKTLRKQTHVPTARGPLAAHDTHSTTTQSRRLRTPVVPPGMHMDPAGNGRPNLPSTVCARRACLGWALIGG